ncbi:hypothetical protein F383_12908 [Gossypium arboreum]|uniref:Uncharacterized protein n=1 Tax=Gossypium arboreum TaxID=29729 RepID=A0A0B0PXN5_GOSAR|nr:hypothetical protein F383_12908 [Gossypium arboreum]
MRYESSYNVLMCHQASIGDQGTSEALITLSPEALCLVSLATSVGSYDRFAQVRVAKKLCNTPTRIQHQDRARGTTGTLHFQYTNSGHKIFI